MLQKKKKIRMWGKKVNTFKDLAIIFEVRGTIVRKADATLQRIKNEVNTRVDTLAPLC